MIWLLFLATVFAEVFVFAQVAQSIGLGWTLLVAFLAAVVGLWLVKREGLRLWGQVWNQLDAGRVPSDEAIDGVVLLVAGGLFLFPGFVTDVVGALLLVPPVRHLVRRHVRGRADVRVGRLQATEGRPGEVIDTTARDDPARRPELLP